MPAFGVEVKRRLVAQGKDASWLHQQTGISHSTISNWFSNPNVQPKPLNVAKVAKALGVDIDVLAPSAGYTIRVSADDRERAQRRAAVIAARPRLDEAIDKFPLLNAYDEDVLLSMIETFLATRLPPGARGSGS